MTELTLTIIPAFEGRLEVRIANLDGESGVLECRKQPPSFSLMTDPRFDLDKGELCWNVALGKEQLGSVRVLLGKALLSNCPERSGIDGDTCQLTVRSESGATQFSWWSYHGRTVFDRIARMLVALSKKN